MRIADWYCRWLLGVGALLLSGCFGEESVSTEQSVACSLSRQNEFVLEVLQHQYLYNELLPTGVRPEDYATPHGLLDALLASAREQVKGGKHFSYLTTISEDEALFGRGEFVGFGFGIRLEPGGMRITQVIPGSPADDAGLERGMWLLAIDEEDIFSYAQFFRKLGPPEEGVQRQFLMKRNDGSEFSVRLVRSIIYQTPLPFHTILPQSGTTGVGYVDLRSFIIPAHEPLREIFAEFSDAGITDFILDFRYNGGGLLITAELLGDLLGGKVAADKLLYEMRFNSGRSQRNYRHFFYPHRHSVQPHRILFITSGGTASASEMLINGLQPHFEVAMVGEPTFGKPVGQESFRMTGCNVLFRPVSFDIANALGNAGYFDGLPMQGTPVFCPSTDDLDHPLGDPREDSLHTALRYLQLGQCPLPEPMAKQWIPQVMESLPPPRTLAERYFAVH